jgi:hypothetical protein
MDKDFFDIQITFENKEPVIVTGVTRAQMGQLQKLFDAAPGSRKWDLLAHRTARALRARFDGAWRRILQWMAGGALLLAFAQGALAQELKARAVEPIRVALTFEESERAGDFNEQLRVELNKLRRVAIASNAVHFDIYVTAGPIVAGEKTIGYVSAVAVVTAKAKDRPITVLLVLGPTPAETARRAARRISEEFFEK